MNQLGCSLAAVAVLALGLWVAGCGEGSSTAVQVGGLGIPTGDFASAPSELNGTETLAEAEASGAPSISLNEGRVRYFAGYRQVSANNRDPVVMKFRDGTLEWSRDDYEVTNAEVAAYGLHWADVGEFFVVFRAVGAEGSSSDDLRRFTQDGWIGGPGSGGAVAQTVLVRVRESDGEGQAGTWLRSELATGDPNALAVTGLSLLQDDAVEVSAESNFSPLKPDGTRFDCSGVAGSPIPYRIVLTNDLRAALEADATGCS